MSVTDQTSPTRVCAGIDWAKDDHAICIVGDEGEALARFSVAHDAAGLKMMITRLRKAGVADVGIERPDGPVVDALLAAGLIVLVIAPAQIKSLRSRYGSAGNKDDRFDAYVLADVVRTDRRRLRPLHRDSAQTTALRTTVRARRELVAHRVAVANQLRAHLQIVFPAAAMLFADIDSEISLRFLERFTTQTAADWLSPLRLARWLSTVSYSGRTEPAVLHARITAAPRGVTGAIAETYAASTRAYLALLRTLTAQITLLAGQIGDQLEAHPDAPIITSLPRSGTVRAARMLAEIGDARGRFPTPQALSCLAGVAPATRQSGKTKTVGFRFGADKNLRDALCDFAADSRRANPWAADLYNQARARGHDHPHAVRILARAWTHIIWRCWQDHVPYDPARHHALQRILNNDHQTAA
jgi:transposase